MNLKPLLLISAASLFAPLVGFSVNMTADDANGAVTSFNGAGKWADLTAPSSGNDYFSNDFLLRTPATTTDHVFAGGSLTINGTGNTLSTTTATGTDLNDALIFKGTLAGTTTITINNLTFDNSILRNGSGDTNIFRLAGNGLTVGSGGMGVHVQGPTFIDAPVSGSGNIVIYDNGSTAAVRALHFASSANTFTGNVALVSADRSRFTLDSTGLFNFVISGTNVSNSVFGAGAAIIDGTININTSAADLTIGNTWNLVSSTTKSFGPTFTVSGFSDLGNDLWANDKYQFSELTGALTLIAVPEPSTYAMLAGGLALGVVALRRRRRA